MYRSVLSAISQEVSGQRALDYLANIVRHHRIQASPGYRAAAQWCEQEFGAAGLGHRIHSYPYDGRRTYWASQSFEEWEGTSATLDLLEPAAVARRLCDFGELRISLIQRSAPTPPGGIQAELVVVDNPEDVASYRERDLRGKLVLAAGGDIDRIRELAVVRGGAFGLVSDQMNEFPPVREKVDVPDARMYTSFWWPNPDVPKCFGFVLSPRQGSWLRRLVCQENSAGRRVVVKAVVESRFYPGAIEDVEGLIPGSGVGEIQVTAHLCHPQASANDNASGCAAAMEAGRAIAALIKDGRLPHPRRSLRFLLVPELQGTYAFLASNESLIPNIAAAINLDMVGENQELCGSSFLVEKPPRAIGSFAGDVAALILGTLAADVNLGGTSRYGLFRHTVTPFSLGSDHYILSDPTVGVPCPMLIQWPDKFYHTSHDTIDKVDPHMLARAATLAGTYAYFLACAGDPEVIWLAGEIAAGFAAECSDAGRAALTYGDRSLLEFKLAFLRDCKLADIDSLVRLRDGTNDVGVENAFEAAGHRVRAEFAASLANYSGQFPPSRATGVDESGTVLVGASPRVTEADRIPKRRFRGPIDRRAMQSGLTPAARDEWIAMISGPKEARRKDNLSMVSITTTALYWTDGRRTLAEIAHLTAMERGWCDLEVLVRIYEVLERQGLIQYAG